MFKIPEGSRTVESKTITTEIITLSEEDLAHILTDALNLTDGNFDIRWEVSQTIFCGVTIKRQITKVNL